MCSHVFQVLRFAVLKCFEYVSNNARHFSSNVRDISICFRCVFDHFPGNNIDAGVGAWGLGEWYIVLCLQCMYVTAAWLQACGAVTQTVER